MAFFEIIYRFNTKNELAVKDDKDTQFPRTSEISDNLREVFGNLEELKNKDYLDVTELCKKEKSKLSYEELENLRVTFMLSYWYIPCTKKIYVPLNIRYNNKDLVIKMFEGHDNLFYETKYVNVIKDFVLSKINQYNNLCELPVIEEKYTSTSFVCKNENEPVTTMMYDYKLSYGYSKIDIELASIKHDIIASLNYKLKNAYGVLKTKKRIDYIKLLIEMKREYIDFLNISDKFHTSWGDRKEDGEKLNELCQIMNVNGMNETYKNKLSIFEDLIKTESSQRNIALADTLNTIQIASLILTMIGWALVILQGNLPQGNLIYILAILLGGCVSVALAIVIKKLVSK